MFTLVLVPLALGAPPVASTTDAESERAVEALWDCPRGDERECEEAVRRDCVSGKFESCGWLGAKIGNDDSRHAEALGLLVKACEGGGVQCVRAADLTPTVSTEESGPFDTSRRLLALGCDAGDAPACSRLADSWDEGGDADIERVISFLGRACALKDDFCVAFGVALVRGPASGMEQGVALLRTHALQGDRSALDALVAIRWGLRENLPADWAAALEVACTAHNRRESPKQCPELVQYVVSGTP